MRMQNKNLRGAVVEIQFLEICIFHVRTFCKSLELQLVQIKSVQVLKEISTLKVLINTALQAATILVAMASKKKFWRPKFWRKSPIGNQQIKRETYLH